jgi:hypothetical protein
MAHPTESQVTAGEVGKELLTLLATVAVVALYGGCAFAAVRLFS